ncbi:MAG: chemotaxis-specific protein-glutamate methyltransferase CheB [Phormidesmis sp.]
MIKVAIANDTLIALEALRRVIATDSAYELIWSAKDGAQAVALCAQQPPDLMLMDVLMPGIDGVEATRQIMARSPCAILLVTASMHSNTSKIFEAMGHGALDVVGTPTIEARSSSANTAAAQPLLAKMATVAAFIGKSPRRRTAPLRTASGVLSSRALPALVVIGASTGGPKALAQILGGLPADSTVSVVVVQHIDRQFSQGLATWLNEHTALSVRVAVSGDRILPGQVLIAGTDDHLVMRRDRTLTYRAVDDSTPYHPSVDVFFNSVSQHWPQLGQAVLLTGMGRDGAAGLAELRVAGWCTIAESEASCVVYGMPRAAVEMDAAEQILAASEIAGFLQQG